MSFADRLSSAILFEQQVLARLNASGWPAFPFGQGQLPIDCRERLIRFEDACRRPSLLRWMPDIITFHDLSRSRSFVALIDAKTTSTESVNYAVEMSAIEAAEIYTDRLYTPTFFVFNDWGVLTPRDARQRGRQGPDAQSGRGSGTPYLLVLKRHARPFDEVFPTHHPTGERHD